MHDLVPIFEAHAQNCLVNFLFFPFMAALNRLSPLAKLRNSEFLIHRSLLYCRSVVEPAQNSRQKMAEELQDKHAVT